MKAIELKVVNAGTVEICRAIEHEPNHTDDSGVLARYQATSPAAILDIVKRHDNVIRANSVKAERTSTYTLRKAENDWNTAVDLSNWAEFSRECGEKVASA